MNLAELERKLIAAAKANPPSDCVPYTFEKRIMARLLQARPLRDHWAQWAGALWRASVPCVAIMLLLSAWSFFAPLGAPANDLSQEFENTVLAAVDQDPAADSTW